MVPYIKKSFVKHYRDGLTYCEDDIHREVIEKLSDSHKYMETLSIEDTYFKECKKRNRSKYWWNARN